MSRTDTNTGQVAPDIVGYGCLGSGQMISGMFCIIMMLWNQNAKFASIAILKKNRIIVV